MFESSTPGCGRIFSQPQHEDERAAVDEKLRETRAALKRYFRAFELASRPEEACASRIAELTEQAHNLEPRRTELAQAAEDLERPEKVRDEDLAALRCELEQALEQGPLPRRKTILQTVIEEIAVDFAGRDQTNLLRARGSTGLRNDGPQQDSNRGDTARSCGEVLHRNGRFSALYSGKLAGIEKSRKPLILQVAGGSEHRVDSFRVEPPLFGAAPHGETC